MDLLLPALLEAQKFLQAVLRSTTGDSEALVMLLTVLEVVGTVLVVMTLVVTLGKT